MICSYSLINGKDNQNLETFETKQEYLNKANTFAWMTTIRSDGYPRCFTDLISIHM